MRGKEEKDGCEIMVRKKVKKDTVTIKKVMGLKHGNNRGGKKN